MKNLDAMLDALATRAGSDRKAAPLLGISQVSISKWRTGKAYPDDDSARKIAALLGLDAAYVLAVIHGERAKSRETRDTWQRIAAAFNKAAALAIISAAPFMAPDARAGQFNNSGIVATSGSEYTLRRKQRRVLGVAL